MTTKADILKKLASTNTPYYKSQDIVPRDAGVSRLHDNSGNKLYKDINMAQQQKPVSIKNQGVLKLSALVSSTHH